MSELPRFIRARRPNLIRSMASLVLLAVASSMFLQSAAWELRLLSWGCIVFTVVVLIRLTVRHLFTRDISLTDQGFWLGEVGKGRFVAWQDVARFGILSLKRQDYVVYSLADQPVRSNKGWARLRGLPADVSGYFPPSDDITSEALLALLNHMKTGQP